MTLAEVHVKWPVILIDLLGPDILLALWMKGQVLSRARAHLKVPGWSLDYKSWFDSITLVYIPWIISPANF